MKTQTLTLGALSALAAIILIAGAASAASVQISSSDAQAGDYTMTVKVSSDFHLVPLMAQPQNHVGEGHIHYLVKVGGSGDFKDVCSAGRATCAAATDYATPKTSFEFKNLQAGDIIGARLVNNDHSSLSPDVLQQTTVMGAMSKGSPGVAPVVGMLVLALAAFVARRQA